MDSEELLRKIAETVRKENEDFAERQAAEKLRRSIMLDLYDREVEARAQQKKQQKPVPTFKEYFIKEYRETLPQALKSEFKKDTKTTLVILVHTLKNEYDPPLLIIPERRLKAFHSAMQVYFGTDIGEYQNYSLLLKDSKETRNSRSRDILDCKTRIKAFIQSTDI